MTAQYIETRYMGIINAVMCEIERELLRCYWNANQEEMRSPFRNTGESYSNDTFSVYAYDCGWDGNTTNDANFRYKDFSVGWYKHCGRGMWAMSEHPLTLDDLTQMLENCCESIRRDFKEDKD
jgi:hypothetical protein